MIKKNAPKKFLKSNKLKKIKILAKKPERGGIPEIEKKIMMKDTKPHRIYLIAITCSTVNYTCVRATRGYLM